jgi:PGF-pre-PGF domain-containing protein
VSFTSNSDDSEANVSVTESKNLSSGMRENVSSEPEGEVYSYTEVETDIDAVNATFEFEISESELSRRNASPDQIVQQRYNGTEWNPLETEHLETVNGTHEFQAFSPEGFSVFATTIQEDDGNKVTEDAKTRFIGPAILSLVAVGLIYLGLFKRDEVKQTLQKLQEKLEK